MGWTLALSPLVPWWAIAALAAVGLALVAWSLVRKRRGAAFRAVAILLVLAALADPRFQTEAGASPSTPAGA